MILRISISTKLLLFESLGNAATIFRLTHLYRLILTIIYIYIKTSISLTQKTEDNRFGTLGALNGVNFITWNHKNKCAPSKLGALRKYKIRIMPKN